MYTMQYEKSEAKGMYVYAYGDRTLGATKTEHTTNEHKISEP